MPIQTPTQKFTPYAGASAPDHTLPTWTPQANTVYSLWLITGRTTGDAPAVLAASVVHAGMTWTAVTDVAIGSGNVRGTLLWGVGASPSADATQVSLMVSSTLMAFCVEHLGADTTAPILDSSSTSGATTSLSINLGASAAGSATLGYAAGNSTSATLTAGTNFTDLGPQATAGSPSVRGMVEYDMAAHGTVAVTGSSSTQKFLVAVELKAATAVASSTNPTDPTNVTDAVTVATTSPPVDPGLVDEVGITDGVVWTDPEVLLSDPVGVTDSVSILSSRQAATLKVLLDDGTQTFPYDVTNYVHMPSGVEITRGRGDEQGQIEASQLSLRLDNVDGRFTLGDSTYDVYPDQMIRVVETAGTVSSVRFTGYVQEWPTEWATPTASYAVAQVTAVDRWARLARGKLWSMLAAEILADEPAYFYALDEPDNSTRAGDTSGFGRGSLSLRGTGDPPQFGQSVGFTGSGVQFASGKYLSGTLSQPLTRLEQDVTFELVVVREADQDDATNPNYILHVGVYTVFIATDGTVAVSSGDGTFVQTTTAIADGVAHHILVTHEAAYTPTVARLRIYLDGVLESTDTADVTEVDADSGSDFEVGGGFDLQAANATVATFALYPDRVLDATRIQTHANAAVTGHAGDSSDERVKRLAAYANIDPSEVVASTGMSTSLMGQDTSAVSAAEALAAVNESEGGAVFVNGPGLVVFQDRSARVRSALAAPTLTMSSADVDPPRFAVDLQGLVNDARATSQDGGTQRAVNQTSIDRHDQYPLELSGLLISDAELFDRLNYLVHAYGEPRARVSQVSIDLLTLPPSVQEAALRLELGDRLTITGLPSQSPAATVDLIVEGWTETVSDEEWSLRLNASPAALYSAAWVLGDATAGVLGTTTWLYY